MAIEIRQRLHGHRIVVRALDDDREPEAELAQPHRRGVDVHAEDRPREEVAPERHRRARVARARQERGERIERVHEERSGAARRIEHPQLPHALAQHASGRLVRRAAVQHGIPCITTLSAARAAADGIAARRAQPTTVRSLQELHAKEVVS